MKKILIVIAFIILILVISKSNNDYYVIPNDAIRLRIVANSNSNYDQFIKMKVRDNLEEVLSNNISMKDSIDDARISIKNNLNTYEKVVSETLNNYDYEEKFKINFGYNYFPKKEYKGVIYEEGMYESLLVTIGEGQGDNWWCVLFPPICSLEVDESYVNDVEYRFYIKDMFDKYLKKN